LKRTHKPANSKSPRQAEGSQPKLHKNLVAAVIEALETSFGKGFYVDKVLERILKSNKKWGARDRAFIAESTYEIVRWWRYLWELMGKEPSLKRKELYKLFGLWWLNQGYNLTDWHQWDDLKEYDLNRSKRSMSKDTGVLQSFPIWFDELAQEELGPIWPKIAKELNRPADVVVRTNTLKTNREALKKVLQEEEVLTENLPFNDIGLILSERAQTFRNPSFKSGLYEVQDGGSQQIAPFLQVEPGMKVIDACAGAGGKALHLAAMMQNKGSIIAMDVVDWKLNELKKRARRNGVHNIETRHIENSKSIKRLHNMGDRLLLDVPCSGTGVIKRNPDTKWKLLPEHLDRVRSMQADILQGYTKMLKVNGLVVYATCSILPSENELQVKAFLAKNPGFELLDEKRVNPEQASDGFYMALLKRNA
jgi:16S rRNA (cytosine967-C5)-methyltransferase